MARVVNSHQAIGQMVFVRLLDSAQGRPIQEWRFTDQAQITIGRADTNDVVLSDQQVSRAHAKLVRSDGAWSLLSLGRNGTLVDDRMVSELELAGPTVFRLGPAGPMLRFEGESVQELGDAAATETIGNIPEDMFALLEVDQFRKDQEVDQITGHALFQDLVDQSRHVKARRQNPPQP
jgi:predicted component of type VI protein secretion system